MGVPIVQFQNKNLILTGGEISFHNSDKKTRIRNRGDSITLDRRYEFLTREDGIKFNITHDVKNERIKIENRIDSNTIITFDGICMKPGSSSEFELDIIGKSDLILKDTNSNKKCHLYIYGIARDDDLVDSEDINDRVSSDIPNTTESRDSVDSDEHDKISTLLDYSSNAVFVGKGISRKVFKVNDKSKFGFISQDDGAIVKVGLSEKGVETNRKEVQTWQAVKGSEAQKFFCPITSIGPKHEYIIMREADDIREVPRKIRKRITNDIKDEISFGEDLDEMWNSHWDIHSSNVGRYNGKPVLVDYPYGARFTPINEGNHDIIKKILRSVL